MTSNRGQNVSILQHPTTEPWDPPITAFTDTGASLRTAPRTNSLRIDRNSYRNGKSFNQHSSTGKISNSDCGSLKKCSSSLITNSVSSSSILNSVNRELSPVRWCDREVDGVYLGRSGWVQVQHKSLDDSKGVLYGINNGVSTLPTRKNYVDLNSNTRSVDRRERNRPVNLPLSMKKRTNRDNRERPSKFIQELGMSPPSITPIISPPPAFKDDGLDIKFSRRSVRQPIFPKEIIGHNLEDSEGSPSPPTERQNILNSSPSPLWTGSVPRSFSNLKNHRPPYQSLHTKSLEDERSDKLRYSKRSDSSSPFSTFSFRSLDNDIKETTDFLYRTFDTSEQRRIRDELQQQNDQEIENERHYIKSQNCEGLRFSSKPFRQRNYQRDGRRTNNNDFGKGYRTRSSSSDSSSSSASSESSLNDKNSEKASSLRLSSKQGNQPFDFENSHNRNSRHFYVKRSRSLQLSEKRSPCELMLMNRSSSGKSCDPLLPERPPIPTQNNERSAQFPVSNQRLHHVLVTADGESIPVFGACNQSIKSLSKITASEVDQKKLIKEAEKEARIISEFLNGTRSRAAARNLLMHRYFNQTEDFTDRETPREYDVRFSVTDQRSQNNYSRGNLYQTPNNPVLRQPSTNYSKPLSSIFRTMGRSSNRPENVIYYENSPNHRNPEMVEKTEKERSCLIPTGRTLDHRYDYKTQNSNRSLGWESKPPKEHSFSNPKNSKKQNTLLYENSNRNLPLEQISGAKERENFQKSSSVSSSSSSSSFSDVFQYGVGLKCKKTGKIDPPDFYRGYGENSQMVFTHPRPGSAPETDDCISMGIDHRSLSLPRSFLSDRYRINHSNTRELIQWKQGGETSDKVINECPVASQVSRTAPTTPVREIRYDRSPDTLNEIQCIGSSATSLYDESSHLKPLGITQKAPGYSPVNVNEKNAFLPCKKPADNSSETLLKKVKKNFSLKNKRTKDYDELTSQETEGESVENSNVLLSVGTGLTSSLELLGNDYEFQQQTLGLTKAQSKNKKAFKNEKYDSHDSGIQMGHRGNVESSESQDTDFQEDVDSPLAVRRREIRANDNFCRPQSEVFNQILIDKFKADLQWRTKSEKNNGRGVRRTNSDLGGQRLYNWDVKNHSKRYLNSSSVRDSHGDAGWRPPGNQDSNSLGRILKPRLRRSLSQPLGLNELPSFVRRRSSTLKCFALSEDEKPPRGRNSEDELLSDSESSVASLSERKKSFDFTQRDETVILAEAVWDHVAMESCELPFRAGDVIEVLNTRDKDWWWGATSENIGYFPSAFVRLRVSQEDTVEDYLAAVAKGKHASTQLRKGKSVSLLSNDQVRSSIVRELLSTERDFVKILRDVRDGYIIQCKRRTEMFTPAQITAIFSNLEDLLVFQEKFLKDLETRVDQGFPHKSCIGEVFLNHGSGFRMYSEYCNSHPIAIATLQDLYQKSNYCKFFETCRLKQNLIEIPLDGYLLTPVQRICKYPLQLAELLKYTKTDHPDFKKVEEALETMRSVANLINERKRKMESLEKLAAWQQRVEGWEGEDLIEISSQLIHQGDVVRITSGMWTSNVTLFLFDHQIVYCKKDLLKRNVYIYKGRIFLDTSIVVDLPDGKNQQLGVTVKYGIQISNSLNDKWLLFCCRSSEDKAKWLQAFAEERIIVTQDKEGGLDLPPTAKQLAKMAAKTKKCPPCKPRGKNKFGSNRETIFFRNSPPSTSKSKSSRRVGTWFTFGGVMKNSKVSLRPRPPPPHRIS